MRAGSQEPGPAARTAPTPHTPRAPPERVLEMLHPLDDEAQYSRENALPWLEQVPPRRILRCMHDDALLLVLEHTNPVTSAVMRIKTAHMHFQLQGAAQVVSAVTTPIGMQLMHAAIMLNRDTRARQDSTAADTQVPQQCMPTLLGGLPVHLQALAFQAHDAFSCVHKHRTLHVVMSEAEEVEFITAVLPHLPHLVAVKLTVDRARSASQKSASILDPILPRLMHAAVSPERLKTLHLTFDQRQCPLTPPLAAALADGLGQRTQLESLLLKAGDCGSPAAAAALARQICAQPHLTRLELSGLGLVQSLASTLSTCMQSLTELRQLHVADDCMPSMHTEAIVGAAAELPELRDLLLGGAACTLHIGSDAMSPRERSAVTPPACPADCSTQLMADIDQNPGYQSTRSLWSGLGAALESHAAGFAQLTRLALVRCVRCEDMLGLGAALACMRTLQAVGIIVAHGATDDTVHGTPAADGWVMQSARHINRAQTHATRHLLLGLAAATALNTLELAGLLITKGTADALVRVLAALPKLHRLVLSDITPSHCSWRSAVGVLAEAVASGARCRALRDLHLLSSSVDPEAAEALAAALGSLSSLTALNYHISVTMTHLGTHRPALAGALRRLPGLQHLSLSAGNGSLPTLPQSTTLTQLTLQLQGVGYMVMETPASPTTAVALPEYRTVLVQMDPETQAWSGVLRGGMQMLAVLELICPHLVNIGDPFLVEELEAAVHSLPRLQEVRMRGAFEEAAEELALAVANEGPGVRVCTSRMCYQAAAVTPTTSADPRTASTQASPLVVCRSWALCDCAAA